MIRQQVSDHQTCPGTIKPATENARRPTIIIIIIIQDLQLSE